MPGRETYRPHLDGLRSLAAYLVVLFHAGLVGFSGGFIGVDLFFVLSGYLVTQTLLRDLQGEGGRVRIARFYARRFRRLLPAAVVALLATALVYREIAAPGQAADAMRSFQASFLYVANWYFIHQAAGYFGAAIEANPTLHVWSLAVEEQFYVVWPLLLAGLFAGARRLGGPAVRSVRIVVALLAAGSLGLALALQGAHPDRAYFGTDTRAYQLLAGALLALTPGIVARLRRHPVPVRLVGAGAVAVLVALGTSWITVGPIGRGIAATAATLAALAALDAVPSGLVHRVLASPPLTYLGRISYGTYLWHWPVIVVLVTIGDLRPPVLAAVTALVASGLASLSAHLVELPIRRSPVLDRHRFAVIGTGLVIGLVCALVIVPSVLRPTPAAKGARVKVPTTASGFTPVPENLDLDAVAAARFGQTTRCLGEAPSRCTIVRGSGIHVMLMGDSNAQMLIPAFRSMAREKDLTLSLGVTGGCPWQRGYYALSTEVRQECEAHKEDLYDRVIPALKPDVIVLVNVARTARTSDVPAAEAATRASLRELRAPGRTLVLLDPVVTGPIHPQPLTCLQKATSLEECRFVARTTPSPIDRMYRRVDAARPDVRVANIDQIVCPFLPICDPVIGGRVVRWDYQHITTAYSASLGDELAAYFAARGFIPR